MANIEEEGCHLVQMWSVIFRGLVTIGKRDQASEESLLPRFYPHFKTWLSESQFPPLLEVARSLIPYSGDSPRTASPVTAVLPAKSVLVYALGNKVSMSHTYIYLPSLSSSLFVFFVVSSIFLFLIFHSAISSFTSASFSLLPSLHLLPLCSCCVQIILGVLKQFLNSVFLHRLASAHLL